ncbi:hypothetical protein [Haloimpatiens lingqiaonensis]|uniref:hypothetical protein n=1 Tax=Haloimpatiens lingqiaonensis TaxID=1380675 RepID=UPI0010FE077B|nr:hypothetical protein [Haloimpatiens lingqiaonensis]
MSKLYYCNDCKRVFKNADKCDFCNSFYVKELKVGKSVNVIGTKQKGKVLKIKGDDVTLILIDEMNNKYTKDYKVEELRKVL